MKVKIICGCAKRLKRHDHRQMFHQIFPEIFKLDDRSRIEYVEELLDKGNDVSIITNSEIILNRFRVARSSGDVEELSVVFLPYDSDEVMIQDFDANGCLNDWYSEMVDANVRLLEDLYRSQRDKTKVIVKNPAPHPVTDCGGSGVTHEDVISYLESDGWNVEKIIGVFDGQVKCWFKDKRNYMHVFIVTDTTRDDYKECLKMTLRELRAICSKTESQLVGDILELKNNLQIPRPQQINKNENNIQ